MTDRPILFSAPMVRALLDDRKTQTRRLLKVQPPSWATFCQQPTMLNALQQWVPSGLWAWSEEEQYPPRPLRRWPIDAEGKHYWLRPRFSVGDRLWVKETHAIVGDNPGNGDEAQALYDMRVPVYYRADDVQPELSKWRPSIFLRRRHSRLTLIVTDVRVERLQDISEADAIAEGAKQYSSSTKLSRPFNADWKGIYREGYAELWNAINGAGSWEANPWVAAYTFSVIKQNIDQIEKVAA